ncbi:sigma-54 dependent transcriptional regulator [Tibeticola sp.]|uniref:sigma-54-dependent transcriptional regulator n=1 Tax=Tibeticola sp. TaxID=2005368 RepID=UPI002586642F|nr:sigma-54 dependent transcriptional regulator [Tibeticola sp.]MCI4440877.1 sigma-54-dependent Fis family transcriptional regulator [Tibeticola sp.]
MPPRLLLIEDDLIMGESLVQRFELEALEVVWYRTLAAAQAAVREGLPGVRAVISDVRLPDGLATEWFVALPARVRALPWFFLTGYGSVDAAVQAVRAGAREFMTKPFDVERLVQLVHEAVDAPAAAAEAAVLGISPAMRHVERMIRKVAPQKVSVLLDGESGVGKEVAAKLIHALDERPDKGEFVAVNCAAIPENLLESEFFGYEKGAFTGAQRTHRGYLERADHGTLFLDEVGELPLPMQAKLLRALQERAFFRVGAERATHSQFRIVAATNRDLQAEMRAGTFREDLFYRLAVFRITLPPLRERPEDIRWLTQRFLEEFAAEQGHPIAVSESFMRDLLARHWGGNVRELRAYLEQAVILSEAGILDEPLPASAMHAGTDRDGADATVGDEILPLHAMVAETERAHIRRALAHCQGSIGKTAELLGISRKTLWEKMKRLALEA